MAYLLIDTDMRFHDLRMTKIWERIYQGCYDDAEALIKSNPEGITFVLNCTPDPIHFPSSTGIKTKHLVINDGYAIPNGVIDDAMWYIGLGLQGGGKILINCHAGISRSTTIIAAWMSLSGFGTVDQCVDYIKLLRPIVLPHPEVLKSIKKYLREFPYDGSYQE